MRIAAALLGVALLAGSAAARAADLEVPAGTEVSVATAQPLSSRHNVKGELVALTVAADVRIGDRLAIAAGTAAVGQIVDARAKGALGMTGRLVLRPLYVTVGGRTVRLAGMLREAPDADADVVLGVALLSGGITGRSAVIPAGARLAAVVERTAVIDVP